MKNIDFIIGTQMEKDSDILRVSNVLEMGITKPTLYSYIKKNNLEKVGHGLYVRENAWVDEMYLLQLRFPKVVYSMETALFLHDLSEMEPTPLTVTVPAKYNTKDLIDSGTKIYYVKSEWYEIGVCDIKSPEGNILKAYDKERTICDIIRKQADMDVAAFNFAINEYMRRNDKDLNKLIKYAELLKIEKKLRMIMGVLL